MIFGEFLGFLGILVEFSEFIGIVFGILGFFFQLLIPVSSLATNIKKEKTFLGFLVLA
jgi:hypothetical protein